ncbi:hypothetical protein K1T35_35040 [Pseudonocardia sp. DSM 110487]|uniref:hypothetical protein n=1 Tax=Pseudonocardia sp. DSM 110487 TaxID=2865833 RepID=UPI001C6A07CD|nr:hypothetical protein [Pseudonocardia sp. DSM 110487]QYN33659.1 hypothetical protein K1T35_35040 [Pseudonocardia sp. DSM 110487]
MIDRLGMRLDELQMVSLVVHAAYEPDAEYYVKLAAARDVHRVLRQMNEDGDLWGDILYRANMPSGIDIAVPGERSYEQLKESVSDLLSENYAIVLFRMGYVAPPPPPISELLKMTRAAVQYAPRNPNDRTRQIEVARAGLQHFVYQLAQHIPQAEDRFLRRMLRHARVVLPAAALVAQIASAVATGNYDVSAIVDNAQKLLDRAGPPAAQYESDASGTLGLAAGSVHLQQTVAVANHDLEHPELWAA